MQKSSELKRTSYYVHVLRERTLLFIKVRQELKYHEAAEHVAHAPNHEEVNSLKA